MRHKVVLDWDDTPSLLPTGNYLLEVVTVSPFRKPTHFGWILTFRVKDHPGKNVRDWLSVKVDVERFRWQIERTQKFLEAAGLAGSEDDPTTITHKDLLGVCVWAHVEKTTSKKTQQFINRVKSYLNNETGVEDGLDSQF